MTAQDLLGTVNQTTGRLEWQRYTDRIAQGYTGALYEINTQKTNCLVTPNHKLWVSSCRRCPADNYSARYTDAKADWRLATVQQILSDATVENQHDRITLYHILVGSVGNTEDQPIPQVGSVSGKNLLALIGIYVTDGTMNVSYRKNGDERLVARVSYKKGGRKEAFSTVLKELGWRRYEYDRTSTYNKETFTEVVWTCSDRRISQWLYTNCGRYSENKRLPDWCTELSRRQASILIKYLLLGDGYDRNASSYTYYTVSQLLANQLQALAVNIGVTAKRWGPYQNKDPDKYHAMYHVSLRKPAADNRVTRLHYKQNIKAHHVVDTRVVCFTVPNGLLITRRKGKISVHGNSKHFSHCLRLMEMCREILTDGTVLVERPDHKFLRAIRDGLHSFEEMEARYQELDRDLDVLYRKSTLPSGPRRQEIEDLGIQVVEEYLRHH